MAQSPAVVIIARHGMRLDAADQSWHLSTPTPYDPPLTYGGWNQCRALGVRIANLLHTREQAIDSLDRQQHAMSENGVQKRKRRRHRVVIHSSPFLRCLQTSVAISAGLAQFEPPNATPGSSSARSPSAMHSASPKLRAKDSPVSPFLAPITEPKHDLQRDMARRALEEQQQQQPRYRKSKVRVDAWLGEWLNPSYFDQITPPPPSPMMVAGAKAELMEHDALDIFTPTHSHKSTGNSLWGGTNGRTASTESTIDDWSHVRDALEAPTLRRKKSNSVSSVGSNESDRKSSSGRKSPFRPGHTLQRLKSIVQPEMAVYHPPTPSYAISNSDMIPKGYVTHARNATVDVDTQWDSSRPPQSWGSGGEYGEEWSSMHRRFRKGLNNLIQWYSQHSVDDGAKDALDHEQAERHHGDDVEEELVVVLVTHGAGCNALIGALTQQPVLLDVGMASLTMAVRRDDSPPLLLQPSVPSSGTSRSPDPALLDNHRRRSSLDIGLSAVYDMTIVSSSEHLRPGVDLTKAQSMRNAEEALARYKNSRAASASEPGASVESNGILGEPNHRQGNTSTALGSIRRPSTSSLPPRRPSPAFKSNTLPPDDRSYTPPTFTTGLWTPPSGRGTPQLTAQKVQEERKAIFTQLNDDNGKSSLSPVAIDFAESPPNSRPASLNGRLDGQVSSTTSLGGKELKQHDSVISETDDVEDLSQVSEQLPPLLSRGLSQKALWRTRPSGDKVIRQFSDSPKRRWTVNEND